MSREASAWMPLYVGDYLKDTARLTTEQHGAYLLLILDYWSNGAPPDEDAVLQQITKLDRSGWKRVRPALARMFQIGNGEWRHKRIDKELTSAASNAERRSSKAKAAAEARWGHASGNAKPDAQDMQQAMLGACPPQSQSPSSSPDGSEEFDDDVDARAQAPADASPPHDPISLAAELCRIGGVRHLEPNAINRHVDQAREWLNDGFDPDTEIIPAIRDAVASATTTIHSLKFFDPSIRQARARKEAHDHGHEPQARNRAGRAGAGGDGGLCASPAEAILAARRNLGIDR
ncbi:YdaU family protein [Rhizorhabdus histidinilytica]|uniref:YdaU family protein n=1 Tax=Rhizorhabdus histidinilytica TaxID=439228 RepID=UPI00321F7C31